MLGNEALIRAAFEVLGQPAPLNDQERVANRKRDDKCRVGNCVFATPENLREAHLTAIGAWQREFRRRFPCEQQEVLDATLSATHAMMKFGDDLGYDLGRQGKSWEAGLQAIRTAHPGFPEDLYKQALQRGVVSSMW